jgi:DNA-binding response OmpR family regulator
MAGKVKTHTILVADDDPEILGMLSLRLQKRGYKVVEAADGDMALEAARTKKPDLIVLDVMMPGKNGWEVARVLRQEEGTKELGIVMLTAIGEKMNEMTSPLYGADAFIDKPFEFGDLENKIAEVLAKRGK